MKKNIIYFTGTIILIILIVFLLLFPNTIGHAKKIVNKEDISQNLNASSDKSDILSTTIEDNQNIPEIEKENINPNDLVISKLATNKQDLFETNNENEIILTYNFNQPTITSKVIGDIIYDSIEMNDLQNNGDVGKPVLPIKPIEILLPYGKALDDIEVITSNKTTLGDGYNIEPAQEPIPLLPKEELEEMGYDITKPTPKDDTVYNFKNKYPNKVNTTPILQSKKGYFFTLLNIYPVEYIPQTGELSYYNKIVIKIKLKDGAISKTFRNSETDKEEIESYTRDQITKESLVYLNSYSGRDTINPVVPSMPEYKYIIITSEEFKDDFQPLINWKKTRPEDPITAKIVTVEDIYSNSLFSCTGYWNWDDGCGQYNQFDDNASRIRNFIRSAYTNHNTEYVLLGGDADFNVVGGETEPVIVPVRYLMDIPSDVYYSNLDGSWDEDNDNTFGEENPTDLDLYSDVYIGRAPLDSNQEINNWINKVIYYESNDSIDKKPLIIGEHLGFGGVAEFAKNAMEEIRLGSNNHGYASLGFIPPFDENQVDTLYDFDNNYPPGWSNSVLIDLIDSNLHNIINHLGHANVNSNMRLSNNLVDSLNNEEPIFIYSQGCYPGAFDNFSPYNYVTEYDSISEHFLGSLNGAFSVVMNSRYGYGAGNSTNGISQQFARMFWDGAFLSNVENNIGKVNSYSHESNNWRMSSSYLKHIYYETNLLGDPEVSIKIPVVNRNLRVNLTAPDSKYNQDLVDIPIEIKVINQGINIESNLDLDLNFNGQNIYSQNISTISPGESIIIDYNLSSSYFSNLLEYIELIVHVSPVPEEPIIDNTIVKDIWFYNYEHGFTISDNNSVFDCATNQNPEGEPIPVIIGKNNNSDNGIYANNKNNFTVQNCVFKGWYDGVFIENTNNCVIKDNNFENNAKAFVVYNSQNNQFLDNKIKDSDSSIYLNESNDNVFKNNILEDSNSSDNFIKIFDSNNNIFENNVFKNINNRNKYFIYFNYSNSNIIKENQFTNIISGNIITLWKESNNNIIEKNNFINIDYGLYISPFNNENNYILYNYFDNMILRGIFIKSNNNIISGNSVNNSEFGIVNKSNNTIINDNNACSNNQDLFIEESSNVTGNNNYFNIVYSDDENWPIYGVHYCHCGEQWVNGVCVID